MFGKSRSFLLATEFLVKFADGTEVIAFSRQQQQQAFDAMSETHKTKKATRTQTTDFNRSSGKPFDFKRAGRTCWHHRFDDCRIYARPLWKASREGADGFSSEALVQKSSDALGSGFKDVGPIDRTRRLATSHRCGRDSWRLSTSDSPQPPSPPPTRGSLSSPSPSPCVERPSMRARPPPLRPTRPRPPPRVLQKRTEPQYEGTQPYVDDQVYQTTADSTAAAKKMEKEADFRALQERGCRWPDPIEPLPVDHGLLIGSQVLVESDGPSRDHEYERFSRDCVDLDDHDVRHALVNRDTPGEEAPLNLANTTYLLPRILELLKAHSSTLRTTVEGLHNVALRCIPELDDTESILHKFIDRHFKTTGAHHLRVELQETLERRLDEQLAIRDDAIMTQLATAGQQHVANELTRLQEDLEGSFRQVIETRVQQELDTRLPSLIESEINARFQQESEHSMGQDFATPASAASIRSMSTCSVHPPALPRPPPLPTRQRYYPSPPPPRRMLQRYSSSPPPPPPPPPRTRQRYALPLPSPRTLQRYTHPSPPPPRTRQRHDPSPPVMPVTPRYRQSTGYDCYTCLPNPSIPQPQLHNVPGKAPILHSEERNINVPLHRPGVWFEDYSQPHRYAAEYLPQTYIRWDGQFWRYWYGHYRCWLYAPYWEYDELRQ
ncbi:hypothetical protein BST61_g10509 [Cercospora zeina]